MSGNDPPENDHIVRYVKQSNLEFGRVDIGEFQLRENEKGVLVNLIKPVFRTNKRGTIDGYGVARFPKREWEVPIIN